MQQGEGSSDRVFGLVMTGFFGLLTIFPVFSGKAPRLWALFIALTFLLAACFYPAALTRLNRWWMKLGEMLSLIISPVAMGIVFFAVITPMGWMMKLFGKRTMPLRFDPAAKTYWQDRTPPGPEPQSMKFPF